MLVIGLSAKIGCGKTTLANMLVKALGATRLAFGDLLKQECSEYFGFPLEWCYSQEGKVREIDSIDCTKPFPPLHPDRGPTVRELLQWYGTDYRRKQDPDYWVKAMRHRLVKLNEAKSSVIVVVDDVRFPNEAQVCLDNGLLFRIEPYPGWRPGAYAGHESETALDSFDRFTRVYSPEHGMDALSLVASSIVGLCI